MLCRNKRLELVIKFYRENLFIFLSVHRTSGVITEGADGAPVSVMKHLAPGAEAQPAPPLLRFCPYLKTLWKTKEYLNIWGKKHDDEFLMKHTI